MSLFYSALYELPRDFKALKCGERAILAENCFGE